MRRRSLFTGANNPEGPEEGTERSSGLGNKRLPSYDRFFKKESLGNICERIPEGLDETRTREEAGSNRTIDIILKGEQKR